MSTVREALKKAVEILKEGSTMTPILDAELLLMHIINIDRLKLITDPWRIIDQPDEERYLAAVRERKAGKPVQYIINKQEFMGLELYIEEGVLIPRPDTEIIVEKVIELAKAIEKPIVIDMCTGSGAIGLSLAQYLSLARVYGADISEAALHCSSLNAERLGLTDRVTILRSDLFEAFSGFRLEDQIDIIVSNPPYIPSRDIDGLSVSVKGYEPIEALDGGKDGLDFYRKIVYNSSVYLKSSGILAFEIGYNQGQDVKKIIEESGAYTAPTIEKDLAGLDRCVWARKVSEAP